MDTEKCKASHITTEILQSKPQDNIIVLGELGRWGKIERGRWTLSRQKSNSLGGRFPRDSWLGVRFSTMGRKG